MGKSLNKTRVSCEDEIIKMLFTFCLYLCLYITSAQETYQNNANIPLDNIGLLHDIFGTGSPDYDGELSGSLQHTSSCPGHLETDGSRIAESCAGVAPNLISINPAPSVMILPSLHW